MSVEGKNGFQLSGFADEISPDPAEQIRVLRECRIEFLELRKVYDVNVLDLTPEQIESFRKELDANDIKVSCIGSPIGKVDILTDDLEAHFRRFQVALERAKQFETRYIRIFSFYHRGSRARDCRDAIFREMERMVKAAEEVDLVLLHENEKDIYGDSAARCRDLLDTFSHKSFQGIFDPANFVQCGEDIAGHAWPLLQDRITYFHIKDALADSGKVVPAGHGDGKLEDVLRDAHERGFRGFASLEPHLKEDYGASGSIRFRIATDAIRAVLGRL